MSPKKKNRGNKLARMTEEEKLRYLQHKAAMEEEAQRRKQELVATFLKTKMVHEEAFARLNSAKINQQWRHILRQIKCKELKEDMETMKQRFEVGLECKNKVIENLLGDFEDAEFQYSLQYQTQMEIILKLLDLHKNRLSDLQNWYTQQVEEIVNSDLTERTTLKQEFQSQFDKLQAMYNDSRQKSESRTRDLKNKFTSNKNELQTKLLYTMVKMEEKYTDEIRKMKTQYNEVLQHHSDTTDTKKAHYNILANKDDKDTAKIAENFQQLATLTDTIKELTSKHKTLVETYENDIKHLKSQKQLIRKEHRKFREQNESVLARDAEQLKLLSEISNRCIKNLKEKFKKEVDLLQMKDIGQTIRNHAPELEPSTPFCSELDENIKDDPNDPLSYTKFRSFWKRFNNVKIDYELLKKKKQELLTENKILKKSLETYMMSVRRSSSVPRKCGI